MSRSNSNANKSNNSASHNSNANNNGGGPRKSNKQAAKRSKRRRKSNVKASKEFWGELEALPVDVPRVRVSAEPAAVVASLGKVPLTNHEAAADQYLKVAYQRAVMMAGALAAAGDLVEDDDLA